VSETSAAKPVEMIEQLVGGNNPGRFVFRPLLTEEGRPGWYFEGPDNKTGCEKDRGCDGRLCD